MSKAKTITPALAPEVRAFFTDHPDQAPEGAKCLQPGARGLLSESVKATFTQVTGRPVVSASKPEMHRVTITHTQPSGRKVKKTRDLTAAEVRAAAGITKAHGRLPKSAIEAAGLALSD